MTDRANLGIASRFLGAVFLVLLGGLLLLDRALLRANKTQAEMDAESAALLAESYLSGQTALLDRISAIVLSHDESRDSLESQNLIRRLLVRSPGLRRVWVSDSSGRIRLDISVPLARTAISGHLLTRFQSLHATDSLAIVVIPMGPRHSLVGIVRGMGTTNHHGGGTAGLLFDGEALRTWLIRTRPATRLTLAVLSGTDTITFLGEPDRKNQALATAERFVRLSTGGTWRVATTHALTTRTLRWGLWALGVFGVAFLGIGLLREQRRTLLAADRSVELERLYSDVKRANQAKSEFLANVSHELRTPLNAIVGFVELLRDGFYGDLSPRQVLPVDRIAASATHLRHLVDQVLDIAKIAAGRLEVHPESIILRPFVLNIASELESLVSEKNLTFAITVGASLPRVRTDPTHLRQILINLIGNAVKYTQAGTVSVRARLLGAPIAPNFLKTHASSLDEASAKTLLARAPRSGTWIALQVVDTGVGIAKTNLDRIFDEFEQVNAGPRGDSMQRGTGLGLAISRRLARLLGGEVSVESDLGRGSTFTVWLPVNPADIRRETPVTPMIAAEPPAVRPIDGASA